MLSAQLLPGSGFIAARWHAPGWPPAQIGFDPPDIDPLPGPPIIQWLVLEQPWYLAAALILVGLAVLVWLKRQEALPAGIGVGGGAIALGITVGLLGMEVRTDRERVMERSRELIGAIAEPDANQIDLLLGDDGGVVVDRGSLEFSRQQILNEIRAAQRASGRYSTSGVSFTVASYRIREIRAQALSAKVAKTQVNVVGELESGLRMPASWWEIDWERPEGQGLWRVRLVEALWIQGR